jgi:hypothetical protein
MHRSSPMPPQSPRPTQNTTQPAPTAVACTMQVQAPRASHARRRTPSTPAAATNWSHQHHRPALASNPPRTECLHCLTPRSCHGVAGSRGGATRHRGEAAPASEPHRRALAAAPPQPAGEERRRDPAATLLAAARIPVGLLGRRRGRRGRGQVRWRLGLRRPRGGTRGTRGVSRCDASGF